MIEWSERTDSHSILSDYPGEGGAVGQVGGSIR